MVSLRIVDRSDFNPEMLILAREIRELTTLQLAAKSAISRAKIMKWENRLEYPTEGQIAILGDALGFPPKFFTRRGRRYPVQWCGKHYQAIIDDEEDEGEVVAADKGPGSYQLPLF